MRRTGCLLAAVALTALCTTGPDTPRSNDDPPDPAEPRPAGAISGRVLTAAGTPVPDCPVLPEATSHPAPALPELAAVTNAEGHYRWPLPSATYTLTARCAQGTAHATNLVLHPGEELTADLILG
ncbi:carboxypeptidase-like regulatory domain-containing protein [Actinomadura macrotermitis]|uniref:Carboxypeptidase regulatory-like domain-containing protein n=1 Tax=Actinomadura macrotermitis TaxID=2585200 RepID=A0A7K0BNV5_9ACTN|nr:carboxypeptidase-like regulatory domain-containing protein [Actinomadura macrotermitis]MQY02542.1 hypothetical protein [Actinomadura macrotermitis]